jgi:hypothetical protein
MNLDIKTKKSLIRLLDSSDHFTLAQRANAKRMLAGSARRLGVTSWKNLPKDIILAQIKLIVPVQGYSVDKLVKEADSASAILDEFYAFDDTPTPQPNKEEEKMPAPQKEVSLDDAMLSLMQRHSIGMSKDEIGKVVDSKINSTVSNIKDIITTHVNTLVKPVPTEIIIKQTKNQEVGKSIGVQHNKFKTLLMGVQATIANGRRMNLWLWGPPATGKTTAAENVANALELPFYFTGSVEMPFSLIGYMDAKGDLVRTPFREAYENGGVFLFDEIDGSAPAAILALNAAIDGNVAAFPDGMVKKHNDFVCIAGANTVGKGGSSEFAGRSKQDEAFRSRWAFLEWEHDDQLEEAIIGTSAKAVSWLQTVREARKLAKDNGVHVTFSTRASIHGVALLEAGWSKPMVIDSVLRCGMAKESWKNFTSL